MKYVIILVGLFMCLITAAPAASAKTQSFVDFVHQIKTTKEKSFVVFYREPVVYEVSAQNKSLLKQLEESQKNKKPLAVTVDSLTKQILKVKGP